MKVLRTPDSRFSNLPGFTFEPNYVEGLPGYEHLRIHYLDEGPKDANRTYLCLHGEPTWCYLYRKMIPIFTQTGARVIAPDWLGFGRSDKPAEDSDYTFHFHRNMMLAFIGKLGLRNITLVVQDWGGLLGLTLPMEMPERFSRLIVMNTGLGVGKSPGEGFLAWKAYVASRPDLDVGALMKRACPGLSDEEAAAYDAPFPDRTYKAGVRRFPQMVMIEPGMEGVETSKRALKFWREDWDGESFMAIGAQDPVLGIDAMMPLRKSIRNCPEPLILDDAGHFVQEKGEIVAKAALAHFGN